MSSCLFLGVSFLLELVHFNRHLVVAICLIVRSVVVAVWGWGAATVNVNHNP